jgi:hypothetical protein
LSVQLGVNHSYEPQLSKVSNRLLKVFVRATSASLQRLLFLLLPLTVLMKPTRQAVSAIEQYVT